jgi:hypothetical protein
MYELENQGFFTILLAAALTLSCLPKQNRSAAKRKAVVNYRTPNLPSPFREQGTATE